MSGFSDYTTVVLYTRVLARQQDPGIYANKLLPNRKQHASIESQ